MDPVAARLLERESDAEYVKSVLRRELRAEGRVRAELTFDVTNICLEFDAHTATVQDELDPEIAVTVPLDDLRRYSG